MQVATLATREHTADVNDDKRVVESMKRQQHNRMDGQDFRVAVLGYLSGLVTKFQPLNASMALNSQTGKKKHFLHAGSADLSSSREKDDEGW